MNYTIIPVTSNLFGLLDSRGSQWKATKLSATHVIFPFTLMQAIDELPEGVIYAPTIIEQTEEMDYANVYSNIEWTGCVELPLDVYRQFVANGLGEGVIYTPEETQVANPQYKTKMTSAEFARNLLSQEQWAKVEALAQTNPAVGVWRDITLAGEVWVDHPDFIAGLALGVSLGVFTQAEADVIKLGLPL